MGYDVFISYSHVGDDLLSQRVQKGLQRFAKPWWRLRALNVFRDRTALSANPGLWSAITEAMDSSRFFLMLASPEAAQSEWCRARSRALAFLARGRGDVVVGDRWRDCVGRHPQRLRLDADNGTAAHVRGLLR